MNTGLCQAEVWTCGLASEQALTPASVFAALGCHSSRGPAPAVAPSAEVSLVSSGGFGVLQTVLDYTAGPTQCLQSGSCFLSKFHLKIRASCSSNEEKGWQ